VNDQYRLIIELKKVRGRTKVVFIKVVDSQ